MKNPASPHFPSKWQQRQFLGNRRNSTQASQQQKYFSGDSQKGCWAASCQRHPSEGIPPRQEKSSEPGLSQWGWDVAGGQQVYGSHTSALCDSLHTLSSPLESFRVCSYDIFMSAKDLQWQLKVASYWEQGSLSVFLCETSIKSSVSDCTYTSGKWRVALLLHPPLTGQSKIFLVIPDTEIIPHPYRRSFD